MDLTYNCYGGDNSNILATIKKVTGGTFLGVTLILGIVLLITIGMGVVIYNSLSEGMNDKPETVYVPSEKNVGSLVPRPIMDAFTDYGLTEEDDPLEKFKPNAQMLKPDSNPVEFFKPPSRELAPKEDPIEKLDGSLGYKNEYGGFIPSIVSKIPKLEYGRIVPFNRDSLEYIWDNNVKPVFGHTLKTRQTELQPVPLLNGATKKVSIPSKATPKVATAKKAVAKNVIAKEKFDPNAIVAGETEGMSFDLLPPENTDRNIVGCPKIFPILNGAYQKIYVMAANTKEGNLIYEYYGRSKAEARLKFRQAFPGCKIPDSIKVTTRRAEIPSTA